MSEQRTFPLQEEETLTSTESSAASPPVELSTPEENTSPLDSLNSVDSSYEDSDEGSDGSQSECEGITSPVSVVLNSLPGQECNHPKHELKHKFMPSLPAMFRRSSVQKVFSGLVSEVGKKQHQKPSYPEGIKLAEVPSETLLNRISGELVKDRKSLGRELRLKEEVISEITLNNNTSVKEQTFQILYRWTRTYGSDATYKRLIKALTKLKEKSLIEKLPQIVVEDVDTSDEECEKPSLLSRNDQITIYEENAVGGKDLILHIECKLDKHTPKKDQLPEICKKIESYLCPVTKPMETKETNPRTCQETGQSRCSIHCEEESSQPAFQLKCTELETVMGNMKIIPEDNLVQLANLQEATKNLQHFINESLHLLTVSEGKVENLEKLQDVSQKIKILEFTLSDELTNFHSRGLKLKKGDSTSIKTVQGQLVARKKQRERLDKLLRVMCEQFTKEKSTQRRSMFPPSNKSDFRSRRLKTDPGHRKGLPSFVPPRSELGTESVNEVVQPDESRKEAQDSQDEETTM